MTSKTVEKTLSNLERINTIFLDLKKCKTDKVIQTLLNFGEIKFYENFNGITITLTTHSKLLIYANQNRKFHITNFQTHKPKKIKNEILPVLKCMLDEIQKNIDLKIKELQVLQELQNKK
jgi:hypothetical protein